MVLKEVQNRIRNKYNRTLAFYVYRRPLTISLSNPIISFTFDDAPLSAFTTGADILKAHGVRATFYMSLSLLGVNTEVGPIAAKNDIIRSLNDGNELGCHTHGHLDAWETSDKDFMDSVLDNKFELNEIAPGMIFKLFAYPKSGPRFTIKKKLEKYFDCCRGGGQAFNIGKIDLNLLKAYFIDTRTKVNLKMIKKIIDDNASCRGWLIFATHDISDDPSPFGCKTTFFKEVVEYAVRSGALLYPVGEAFNKLILPQKKK